MKAIELSEKLYDYVLSKGMREQPLLSQMRAYGEQHPRAQLLSTPDTAYVLQFLVKLLAPKRVLEIGTFIGYSTAAMALGLSAEGHITTCEIDAGFAAIAEGFWQQGGLDKCITCHVAPALTTLATLPQEHFDFIFIDADKSNYANYYELSISLLRAGGLLILDNMLWYGRVADSDDQSQATTVIRELTETIQTDNRVEMCMLTIGDGLLAVKKL
ncbi:MAG: class I SAM-dependent methyltransferase [Gammaproteobacteria bacterium]|nr:class I SAM-dependent methyltransferase [Gammaproteobacteria bacterium]